MVNNSVFLLLVAKGKEVEWDNYQILMESSLINLDHGNHQIMGYGPKEIKMEALLLLGMDQEIKLISFIFLRIKHSIKETIFTLLIVGILE